MFNFNDNEILTFFLVLVRYTVLFAVMPFFGDAVVPGVVRVLLGTTISFAMFPALVSQGWVNPSEAEVWGSSAGSIIAMTSLEVLFGLCIGFLGRLIFDTLTLGGTLAGTFMGFAMASQVDPLRESQTQTVSQIFTLTGMMVFLAGNGHHLMLQSVLDSYRYVHMGGVHFGPDFSKEIIGLTGHMFRIGLQLAAPIAFSVFVVNVVYGLFSKAMPQLNILVLSFAVTALIGLVVMYLSFPDLVAIVRDLSERVGDTMSRTMRVLGG